MTGGCLRSGSLRDVDCRSVENILLLQHSGASDAGTTTSDAIFTGRSLRSRAAGAASAALRQRAKAELPPIELSSWRSTILRC